MSVNNPHFLTEAGDYLKLHGFTCIEGTYSISFYNGDKGVQIVGDTANFLMRQEEEADKRGGLSNYQTHTGIDQLTLFDWLLLFHITDTVPLQQFISASKKEMSNHGMYEDVNIFEYAAM